jgi:hypothetical protein
MTMLFKSELMTQASGSLGGITASRNKSGMYFRSRATPTNPNTPYQVAVRAIMAQLAAAWGSLSATNQGLWQEYAWNVPVLNPLGDQIELTGQQMFIRSNVPRIQAGLARVDAGPTTFNLGEFTTPVLAAPSAAAPDVGVAYTAGDAWANEDGSALLVYEGRPKGPGVSYMKGPFRYNGKVSGNSVTPPTSPYSGTPAFAQTEGNKFWAQIRITRADGRLSLPVILGPELITA